MLRWLEFTANVKPVLTTKKETNTQRFFFCTERVMISLSLLRQVQSGFQSVLAYMTIEVCHKLYETTQTMVSFVGLNLCISYICMCLEYFNIKEVITNLGKPVSRDFFGQNEEFLLSCFVCLQRVVSNEFGQLTEGTIKPSNTYAKDFCTVKLCSPQQTGWECFWVVGDFWLWSNSRSKRTDDEM